MRDKTAHEALLESLNDFQIAWMNKKSGFSELAKTRKALIASIRDLMTGAAVAASKDIATSATGVGKKEDLFNKYMSAFDKQMSPQ